MIKYLRWSLSISKGNKLLRFGRCHLAIEAYNKAIL